MSPEGGNKLPASMLGLLTTGTNLIYVVLQAMRYDLSPESGNELPASMLNLLLT
jgi:hypothetical protein